MSGLCPPTFNGDPNSKDASSAWSTWKFRFNNYLIALKLKPIENANTQGYAENQEAIKAHLYCLLGSAPMEALQQDENDTYQQVINKLTQIYLPKEDTNTRIGAFRQIKQLDGENLDHFISRLKNTSIGCGFTNVKNEMVIQITHHAKSRQLKDAIALSQENDYDKIVTMARAVERLESERIQEQKVNAISQTAPRSNHNHHYQQTNNYTKTAPRPKYNSFHRQEQRTYSNQYQRESPIATTPRSTTRNVLKVRKRLAT
jgi:hypothetical protein